jgi:hypothetical protein
VKAGAYIRIYVCVVLIAANGQLYAASLVLPLIFAIFMHNPSLFWPPFFNHFAYMDIPYLPICIRIYVCVYVYMYVRLYVGMYVCTSICACM